VTSCDGEICTNYAENALFTDRGRVHVVTGSMA